MLLRWLCIAIAGWTPANGVQQTFALRAVVQTTLLQQQKLQGLLRLLRLLDKALSYTRLQQKETLEMQAPKASVCTRAKAGAGQHRWVSAG